ncbi:hypothetical protein [Actinacidiphila paucisporea]|uniref:Uncharacterized protein n=1 Tax=Actinacidiphila paucisporea TaxID=310782 RepID=A0A1M7K3M2_9ACTN|nr:hypothetical protein [Actinacidiphila paucisporea]SHM59794.1 hypothetical protein SAMN05216499_112134 [Actinacidiphila paucisporea]
MHVAQAASPAAVAPVANFAVRPADFPFLDAVRGHDDAVLRARGAADPDGFPQAEGDVSGRS